MRNAFKLGCLAVLLAAASARAADDAELVEKVVVKNRLFTVGGRWELGLYAGFTLMPRLTEHYNFNLGLAWNVLETLGLELRAGYAYSRHTGLADQISADFFQSVVAGGAQASAPVTDMANLWEMTGNATLGLRWQPIYGKIGLFSEAALHFQIYVWLGGGAAYFKRDSIIICNVRSGSDCTEWYHEGKVGPVVSVALGMRVFVPKELYGNGHHALRVEVRDYSWLDSYLQDVNRVSALNGGEPPGGGTPYTNAGITNLVQVDVGYTVIF